MATEPASHSDVLIIGAGISGIGAGYYLNTHCPDRSYTILEGRSNIGGTWDLFRYPGIRSDSDMYTLGYSFKPWLNPKAIADGPSIREYVNETADENGIRSHIRFNHRATTAEWSTDTSTWTITATRTDPEDSSVAETTTHTCNFLFMCSGYYSYTGGHEPDFPGSERFTGDIVHPQKWPEELDYTDKNVVVIGSGATAVTLVPAMAPDAKHVTMLQRTPSYVASKPSVDPIAQKLQRFLPEKAAYAATRWKNYRYTDLVYQKSRSSPAELKAKLLGLAETELGAEMVAEHFTPSYNPWDQRLCAIPDSDLFRSLNDGSSSVITDHIRTFTETGIELESGDTIDADIIVTATGLQLVTLGEMDFVVDGSPVDFANTWTYNGMAYSDVPNLVSSFGYINASWTLRVDITCQYVVRLLNHMSSIGATQATPRLRPEDADMEPRPWIDDFSSGYMQRMMPMFPRQGDRAPWLNTQRYVEEKKRIAKAPIDDGVMQFAARVTKPERTLTKTP